MITVHSIPGSPYGRAVLIACLETGAPHRLAPLGPGQHKAAAHLARHPFGRVPAIDHDGFVLYETQAILRYLDAIGTGPSLQLADPQKAARMNQVMGVIDWYFFTQGSAATLLFNRVIAPAFGMPVDEAAIEAAIPNTRHCVDVLAGFVTDSPYMGGGVFSLADIHAGTQLEMLAQSPEGAEMLHGSPIRPWLARLAERPSFQATTWERLKQAA